MIHQLLLIRQVIFNTILRSQRRGNEGEFRAQRAPLARHDLYNCIKQRVPRASPAGKNFEDFLEPAGDQPTTCRLRGISAIRRLNGLTTDVTNDTDNDKGLRLAPCCG